MAPETLYVGNLDSSVTLAELCDHFDNHAPRCHVNYCIIATDSQTNQSLGYGFLEFDHYETAADAMKLLDSTLLMNKPIQVLFSPFHHDLSPCVVFIKNLPKSITRKALFRVLKEYGNIIRINLATDASGYATVRYDCVEAAQTAISHLNGRLFLNNKRLRVSSILMVEKYGFPERAYNKISLRIPGDISERHLRDTLEGVTGVCIRELLPKGKRFAAVTFENSKAADRAADALKSHPRLIYYVGRVHEDTPTFRPLGEMDAKMIVAKQLHLNLFLAPEEDEQQKTGTSQAQALEQALAQAQFFQMCPVSLTSPVGALPVNPLPLPVYSPPVMYPLTGPGFGQQMLFPEALPTQFPLQPGFGHPQQLFPNMWPYETTYWGSGANNNFPDAQGKPQPYC